MAQGQGPVIRGIPHRCRLLTEFDVLVFHFTGPRAIRLFRVSFRVIIRKGMHEA